MTLLMLKSPAERNNYAKIANNDLTYFALHVKIRLFEGGLERFSQFSMAHSRE